MKQIYEIEFAGVKKRRYGVADSDAEMFEHLKGQPRIICIRSIPEEHLKEIIEYGEDAKRALFAAAGTPLYL